MMGSASILLAQAGMFPACPEAFDAKPRRSLKATFCWKGGSDWLAKCHPERATCSRSPTRLQNREFSLYSKLAASF